MNDADLVLLHEGSLVGLWPITAAAREWLDANLPADCPRLGDTRYVEPCYAPPIVAGARDAGLLVR